MLNYDQKNNPLCDFLQNVAFFLEIRFGDLNERCLPSFGAACVPKVENRIKMQANAFSLQCCLLAQVMSPFGGSLSLQGCLG